MNNIFKTYRLKSWPMCLAAVAALAASCSDLLDEMPDNRTELNSVANVKQLLTSAYPAVSASVICGLSADSFEDNNVVSPSASFSPLYGWYDDAFAWDDMKNYTDAEYDSPSSFWEAHYMAIATCNHALQAIDGMLADGTATESEVQSYRGEALVMRAYLHFCLVNVFSHAYKDSISSLADMGIPYVTVPETTVFVDYDRSTVTETYSAIERDLLAGLPLIDDTAYDVPAYHMNKAAANAFAARFFLYKREWAKAERYATLALGGNPASVLRGWANQTGTTIESKCAWYNNETQACNFMLQANNSLLWRVVGVTNRYGINGVAEDVTTNGAGPCWSSHLPCYSGNIYAAQDDRCGSYLFFADEYFESTDKSAGIGKCHVVGHPFTAEETLLCRAEARLYLGDVNGCISDLNTWAASKLCTMSLDEKRIKDFYFAGLTGFVCDINVDKMGWSTADVAVAKQYKHVVDCILHFRHIETVYEGMRWYDVKRYGIPLTHVVRQGGDTQNVTLTLDWNDPRRAIQIPNTVVAAGLAANGRTATN
mgnify:CR=1 FL=1